MEFNVSLCAASLCLYAERLFLSIILKLTVILSAKSILYDLFKNRRRV